MSLDSLETLILILLFLTPGALFIYVSTLHYLPVKRATYLLEQFPLEQLTIVYLIVSTTIHALLVLIALGLVFFIDAIHPQANLPEYLMTLATQRVVPGPRDVMFLAIAIIVYFLSSLALACLGGWRIGKHLGRPAPLWQHLLAEMQAEALIKNRLCRVSLELRGQGKLSGNLVDAQCWAEGPVTFQLLISTDTEDTSKGGRPKRVWIDSREIDKMNLRVSDSTAEFIFSRKESTKDQS